MAENFPTVPAEAARQAALGDYAILDTAPEADFDDLARLAAQIAGVPCAAIGFMDTHRVWFKARVGLAVPELPREKALCASARQQAGPLVIPDLTQDPAWATDPAAAAADGWRFYAGVPLRTDAEPTVGVLCVMDRQPRTLSPAQLEALQILARQVTTQLKLRRNLRRLEQSVAEHSRSEAALELAEARFHSLFEHVGQGIFQTTADGHYLAANTALARIYGYATAAELRAAVQDIRGQLYVDPTRRDEFIRLMREHGSLRHFESQVRRKDGSIIWISENAHAVYDAAGRFLYYEGTVEDITERKAAEEALRNSELLYHSLVESLPQNIFRKDREGRFTFVNRVFCQTLDRPPELILGRTDADFFPPERAAAYRADDLRVMTTERPLELTEEHVKPDGTKLYVHVIKTPLRDSSGQVIGVQGIFWDETHRYQMEAELAYERDLLRALLDTVPDAIYFKDLQSQFIRVSRALAKKFGVEDPQQLHGKRDFNFFTSEHAVAAYADEQRIIQTGEPILNKTEKETWPDGRVTWVRTSKLPYRDHNNRIIGTIGISKDITDLIQTEQALKQARDQALQAAQLREAILANMSHQLRTPLHAIISTADLLFHSMPGEEPRELARQIRDNAQILLETLENILDQARLQAGEVQLEELDFDLREVAEGAVEMVAPTAGKKGLELTCWIHPEVPPQVRGDPTRLRQVLLKLLGNAVKFTPQGEVQLRITPVHRETDRVRLRFEVEDTGIGIAPEQQSQIFEPFRQADASTSRQFGGSGLGLTIARDLVKLMHGDLQLRSLPGQGSTFTFEVQFHLGRAAAASPKPLAPSLRGLRVLVVDDHPASRRILLQILRTWGAVVREAAEPGEAWQLLREAAATGTAFEVALVDATLGETSGLDLARTIREDTQLPPLRLVLLTPPGQWPDAATLRAHGVAECLLKPPSQARLFAALAGQRPPKPGTSTALPVAPRKLRVVVAQDQDLNRALLVQQLTRLGHTVRAAANGNEALQLLEQEPADVLLLDCQMPGLDGYQTALLWRAREAERAAQTGIRPHPPLHIIALTARAFPGQRERCLAAGMNDYLSKPVRLEDLAAALNPCDPLTTENTDASFPGTQDPVLDRTALQTLATNPALLNEMCLMFFDSARDLLTHLKTAADAGDTAALQQAAHTLHGNALNFGARRLGRLAETLERLARQGLLADAPARVAELPAEIEAVRQALATEFPTVVASDGRVP